jgi:DNA adenine methylase
MKTPISYYGGKQKLISKILPLLPEHTLYAEPFIGGGAVFWAKPKSLVEVINDTNRELINFYDCVQNDFIDLEKQIRISLHSRSLHKDAEVINANPHLFTRIERAWAVWVLASQSFCSMLDGSWGYDVKKPTTSVKIKNKREAFTEEYAQRIQNVQIENTDALRIIKSRDSIDSLFYCDPPYFNSNCGHYDGYTIEDFETLLKVLSNLEGKFLLSSYPSELLTEFTKRNGWKTQTFKQQVSVANANAKVKKSKIEVFTYNF